MATTQVPMYPAPAVTVCFSVSIDDELLGSAPGGHAGRGDDFLQTDLQRPQILAQNGHHEGRQTHKHQRPGDAVSVSSVVSTAGLRCRSG